MSGQGENQMDADELAQMLAEQEAEVAQRQADIAAIKRVLELKAARERKIVQPQPSTSVDNEVRDNSGKEPVKVTRARKAAIKVQKPRGITPVLAEIVPGTFFGMSLPIACVEYLKMVGHPLSVRDMWSALEVAKFPNKSETPVKNVMWALRKRMKSHNDVVLIGFGKYGLREWYTDEQIEEFERVRGGTGGRDAEVHSQKTKEGMAALKANGVSLGRKLLMTDEKVERAKFLLGTGMRGVDVAKDLGISPGTLHLHKLTASRFGPNAEKSKKISVPLKEGGNVVRLVSSKK